MKCLRTVYLALFGLLATASARADLVEDSAVFDRAYIPALAYTSQGNRPQSTQAMAQLLPAWAAFRDAHSGDHPEDAQWRKSFASAGQYIADAQAIVDNSGRPLTDAHEALEPVRILFMHLRQGHNIEYFVDHLTAFHEPMETIVLTAKDEKIGGSEEKLKKIRATLPALQTAWHQVQAAPLESGRLMLDAATFDQVKRLMQKETEAIHALEASLAGDDPQAALRLAMGIKPPFARLFMLFGGLTTGE